jgi:hypothetical protein
LGLEDLEAILDRMVPRWDIGYIMRCGTGWDRGGVDGELAVRSQQDVLAVHAIGC